MKYLSTIATIFLVAFIFFVSCDKNSDILSPNLAETSVEVETFSEVKAIGLTESEIQNIGEVHNHHLVSAYNKLDGDLKLSQEAQIEEYFTNLDLDISSTGYDANSLYTASFEAHEQFKVNEYLLINTDLNCTELNSHLEIIYSELEQATSFSSFVSAMDDLYSSVATDESLSDFEKEAIKVSIVVSKSSAELWMPTDMGGSGLTSSGVISTGNKWSWRNALIGDISGVIGVMAELGVAGAVLGTVPGTNVAIGIAVGVASAVGSAIGGLT
jgi:hypothetical protein